MRGSRRLNQGVLFPGFIAIKRLKNTVWSAKKKWVGITGDVRTCQVIECTSLIGRLVSLYFVYFWDRTPVRQSDHVIQSAA